MNDLKLLSRRIYFVLLTYCVWQCIETSGITYTDINIIQANYLHANRRG